MSKYNNDIEEFENKIPIKCRWNHVSSGPGLLFMFNGEVWPCCHVGGVRYGKEQKPWTDPNGNEMAHQWYQQTHGKYGEQFNNITSLSLKKI